MGKKRSLFVTIIILALLWWCYELTDMYAWGAHQILSGFLTVAGFLAIGGAIYVFLRFGNAEQRVRERKKQPWEYTDGGLWQR